VFPEGIAHSLHALDKVEIGAPSGLLLTPWREKNLSETSGAEGTREARILGIY